MKPASKPAENPAMPDIDVLEAAIAAANKDEAATAATPQPAGDKSPKGNAAAVDEIPALALDETLDDQSNKSADLNKMAEKLSKAGSLTDLTDTVAETLFGNAEFNAIAAEVVANPPPSEPTEDASPVMLETEDEAKSADADKPDLQPTAPDEKDDAAELSMSSTTRRLDLVMKLNSGGAKNENTGSGDGKPGGQAAKKSTAQPETIEEQMKTAMTGTLKTLSSADAPPAPLDKDEPKDKKSGGLFSRLGRSS